jgi:hypothetical protein
MKISYTFTSKIWLYPTSAAAWHFATVPKDVSEKIKMWAEGKMKTGKIMRRGFGSRRVAVALGKSRWETSIFPDKKSGTYLLPIKARVRGDEMAQAGDVVKIKISIIS